MFGKIVYISDNIALVENKISNASAGDVLNLHVILEYDSQKILGEIVELKDNQLKIKFLGEFIDGKFYNGLLRKASLNSKIRVINAAELQELIGEETKETFLLGESATYRDFNVYPNINDLFASHMCIFGNSGSGKSCGVARIIQNILEDKSIPTYNSNLIFFDSFGEYKNAFANISAIDPNYSYKFITADVKDPTDKQIEIPLNLLTVDDFAILLQADKHSQLTILERAIKYAKIFACDTPQSIKYKNSIIANALITILYSQNTIKEKKNEVFSIIDTCHTKEFNFDSIIPGLGYTRTLSECFAIDSNGRFGEEVLITEYILKYVDKNEEDIVLPTGISYSLNDFAKALDFTLISEGFNQNKNMHDDAQILKVRLDTILHNEIGKFFSGNRYVSKENFIRELLHNDNKKCQIVNINLESLDDNYAKALVKIYAKNIFSFAKGNADRAVIPFHLFLEEAHRYIQKDNDVFLLGYNIFDRIAKEGRKYGVILDIISQRPVEISDTVIAQCSNFLIFKMTHPKDIKYVEEMLPNISQDVIDKMKILQPGTCVAFGQAFKIPMICKLKMPNPRPYSANCDVSTYWHTPLEVTEMKNNRQNMVDSAPIGISINNSPNDSLL